MDNATPLKKIKKQPSKFFIIADIILLFVAVTIGGYYLLIYKPSTTKPKASCEPNKLYCRRDDPNVCPDISSNLAGYLCDGNGNETACTGYDGCAAFIEPGSSCDGSGFIGCSCANHQNNCFCENNIANCDHPGGTSCGYNSPGSGCGSGGGSKRKPTPTPGSVTGSFPHPTLTSTQTPTPIPTTPIITDTPTPTLTPVVTVTPTSTVTGVPTSTPTTPPSQPTNTPGPGPSVTPIPVPCGTKDCDNATNPCRSGYVCVQSHDGSNYCSSPDFTTACKANPTFNACCTAPGAPTATPTTITTVIPTHTIASVPTSGTTPWAAFGIIGTIILAGLLL